MADIYIMTGWGSSGNPDFTSKEESQGFVDLASKYKGERIDVVNTYPTFNLWLKKVLLESGAGSVTLYAEPDEFIEMYAHLPKDGKPAVIISGYERTVKDELGMTTGADRYGFRVKDAVKLIDGSTGDENDLVLLKLPKNWKQLVDNQSSIDE
jgi:hypothetical protein